MQRGHRGSERAKQHAQALYARWSRLSRMRRISATVVMAAITAGGVVSACNTDGLTGPAQPAQRATPGVQRDLLFHEHHVPFTTSSSNPCAPADGPITFTGYINVLVGSTVDANGGIQTNRPMSGS